MTRNLARSLCNPLAQQLVTTDATPEVGYLLRATFDVANASLSDAQVLGTADGVTHGSLTVNVALGSADITSNSLVLVNANGSHLESVVAPSVARTPGLVMFARVTVSGGVIAYPEGLRMGFGTSGTDFSTIGGMSSVFSDGSVSGKDLIDGGETGFREAVEATQHDIAVVIGGLDENDALYKGGDATGYTYGALYLHRPNGETNWRVLGRGMKSNAGPLFPFLAVSVHTATIDYVAIPETPAPSILTTGLTYPASDNLPLSFTGNADGYFSCKLDAPGSGVIQIDFRKADADNLWRVEIDPDFVMTLIERTGGTNTQRAQLDERPSTIGQVVYIHHVGNQITMGQQGVASATYTSSTHATETGIAIQQTGLAGGVAGVSDQSYEIAIGLEPE